MKIEWKWYLRRGSNKFLKKIKEMESKLNKNDPEYDGLLHLVCLDRIGFEGDIGRVILDYDEAQISLYSKDMEDFHEYYSLTHKKFISVLKSVFKSQKEMEKFESTLNESIRNGIYLDNEDKFESFWELNDLLTEKGSTINYPICEYCDKEIKSEDDMYDSQMCNKCFEDRENESENKEEEKKDFSQLLAETEIRFNEQNNNFHFSLDILTSGEIEKTESTKFVFEMLKKSGKIKEKSHVFIKSAFKMDNELRLFNTEPRKLTDKLEEDILGLLSDKENMINSKKFSESVYLFSRLDLHWKGNSFFCENCRKEHDFNNCVEYYCNECCDVSCGCEKDFCAECSILYRV